jgi:hypothetical protein
MADSPNPKHASLDLKHAESPLDRTTSITSDINGNTIITSSDGETFTIDRKAERALVWKFDLRILPLLALMYLFNALDKANLGNAATAGLLEDLGMVNNNKYVPNHVTRGELHVADAECADIISCFPFSLYLMC